MNHLFKLDTSLPFGPKCKATPGCGIIGTGQRHAGLARLVDRQGTTAPAVVGAPADPRASHCDAPEFPGYRVVVRHDVLPVR